MPVYTPAQTFALRPTTSLHDKTYAVWSISLIYKIMLFNPQAIIGEFGRRVTGLACVTSRSHPLYIDGVFIKPKGHSEYELHVNSLAGKLFANELASDVALDAGHTGVG